MESGKYICIDEGCSHTSKYIDSLVESSKNHPTHLFKEVREFISDVQ